MIHFFAPGERGESGTIRISGPDRDHIARVLRLKPGDTLSVSDGEDRDWLCEIAEITPKEVILKVLPGEIKDSELPVFVTLYQGLPKGDKTEQIIQKTTELGVHAVQLVEMKRCVVRIEEKKKAARLERWQKIAESAAKQSNRRCIPAVERILRFEEAVKEAAEKGTVLVPYECAEDMNYTRKVLEEIRPGSQVSVFIGPEGGFAPEEIETLEKAGAKIITLGPRILRTETAGMAFLAMASLIWQDR